MTGYARQGLRVLLVVAHRACPLARRSPRRGVEDAGRDVCLLGLVVMSRTAAARGARPVIGQVYRAGLRVHAVTGGIRLTAAVIAGRAGIGCCGCLTVVTGWGPFGPTGQVPRWHMFRASRRPAGQTVMAA